MLDENKTTLMEDGRKDGYKKMSIGFFLIEPQAPQLIYWTYFFSTFQFEQWIQLVATIMRINAKVGSSLVLLMPLLRH